MVIKIKENINPCSNNHLASAPQQASLSESYYCYLVLNEGRLEETVDTFLAVGKMEVELRCTVKGKSCVRCVVVLDCGSGCGCHPLVFFVCLFILSKSPAHTRSCKLAMSPVVC